MYPWLDWQRSWLSAWLELSRLGGFTPLEGWLHPPRELLARTLAAGGASRRALEATVAADARFPLAVERVAATPFARLTRFSRRDARADRRFLLLAPHSGFATVVVSPLVAALAAEGEVLVTDWVDARLVPAAEGRFGLAEQVELGLLAAMALGGPVHIVSLSQSGPAALALASLLARQVPALRPRSLAFLGSPLDPAAEPAPWQRALAGWPRSLLEAQLTVIVGPPHPGAGRRVYPGIFQLWAYGLASPHLYAEVQHGLWQELAAGTEGPGARQHADIHSLADVPAELFLDTMEWLLAAAVWDSGEPAVAGQPIEPGALRSLPVLTVESGRDELVGRGQTHGLARRLGLGRARAVTLSGALHHDLFTGPGFWRRTAPVLRRFHAAVEREQA